MSQTTSIRSFIKQVFSANLKISEITAIRDISLNIHPGEIISVIGSNGAGKSTLLKIVAGILPPSEGTIRVNGKIAPMIELGAGFHPEMNVSENVIFFSSLIGRDIREVRPQVSEICKWAGLEKEMKYPVRAFSSGMIARLAFAVSTFASPQVLLVDEVLSVGDLEFQEKSNSKIRDLVNKGTAILLVSHDMEQVLRVSTKVVWLEKGSVIMFGDPKDVVQSYLSK